MRPIRKARLTGTAVVLASVSAVAVSSSLTAGTTSAVHEGPIAALWAASPSDPPERLLDAVSTYPRAAVRSDKGTRHLPTTALADLDIPITALIAYQNAAAVMKAVDRSCGLSWTLLAAIGRVESDHGRYGGAALGADGVSEPEIRGVALDGAGAVAEIRDSDAGTLDGDETWDRAVGPMQFLPTTWAAVGVDADGDGVRSADDIDDAALGAAVYLCAAPGDLTTGQGLRTAILRYNPSQAYVADVLAVELAYRTGEYSATGEPTPTDPPVTVRALESDPSRSAEVGGGHSHGPGSSPGDPGAPSPSDPSPSDPSPSDSGASGTSPSGPSPSGPSPSGPSPSDPSPSGPSPSDPSPSGPSPSGPSPSGPSPSDPSPNDPSPSGPSSSGPSPNDPSPSGPTPGDPGPSGPSPSGPSPSDPSPSDPTPSDPRAQPRTITGTLVDCGTAQAPAWCLDGTLLLDLGNEEYLASTAITDFDGDATTETNARELRGLAGTEVTIEVVIAPGRTPVVVAIDGVGYHVD